MRVIGIVPSASDLKWALLDGSQKKPRLLQLPSKSQKHPADPCQGYALLSLRRLLTTFFQEQSVEKICILQAGNSQHRGPSAERVKAEGIIQLVGAENDIDTVLIPPQTLRAHEKKFDGIAGSSPETIFNQGAAFKPKAWRDAVLTAWWGLA